MIADEEIDKGLRTLEFIWLAMIGSLFIYLVAGVYIGRKFGNSLQDDAFNMLSIALYAVSFVIFIASRYIRTLVLSYIRKLTMSGKRLPQSGMSQTFQALREPVLGNYGTTVIVTLLMSEGIGLCGMVLFMLAKNQMDLYVLLLVSAIAMVVNRPKRDEMMSLTQTGPKGSSSNG